jgi:hypothetical protein
MCTSHRYIALKSCKKCFYRANKTISVSLLKELQSSQEYWNLPVPNAQNEGCHTVASTGRREGFYCLKIKIKNENVCRLRSQSCDSLLQYGTFLHSQQMAASLFLCKHEHFIHTTTVLPSHGTLHWDPSAQSEKKKSGSGVEGRYSIYSVVRAQGADPPRSKRSDGR